MKLTVNGEAMDLPGQPSLADLCRTLGADPARTAVTVNDAVVPRTGHEACRLHEGDRIEVLTLVAGG
jgi:thiamine biosynthesis protein ThiS